MIDFINRNVTFYKNLVVLTKVELSDENFGLIKTHTHTHTHTPRHTTPRKLPRHGHIAVDVLDGLSQCGNVLPVDKKLYKKILENNVMIIIIIIH